MSLSSHRLAAVLVAAALAACTDPASPASGWGDDPSLAKGGNIDTDSRAVLVWADLVDVDASDATHLVPAGITGDDRDVQGDSTGTPLDAYQGQVCGVHAKIFDSPSRSGSGDLVFDPDFNTAGQPCGAPRQLRIHLAYVEGGAPGDAIELGPFTNVRQIWQEDVVGAWRLQPMRFNYVNQDECTTLAFDDAYLGGSLVRVTRLQDTTVNGALARRWRVETQGTHRATCTVVRKNRVEPTRSVYLPFAFTVTQVPYAAP